MLAEKAPKSTFAPAIDGDAIGAGTVMAGLRHATVREADLPAEAHAAVPTSLRGESAC